MGNRINRCHIVKNFSVKNFEFLLVTSSALRQIFGIMTQDYTQHDGAAEDEEPPPGIYDCSLIQDGCRDRKKVVRLSAAPPTKEKKLFEIAAGRGTCLGDIPIIDHLVSKENSDSLRPLHHMLFKTFGQSHLIKKNIRKFNGFAFEKDSEEHAKKTERLAKMTIPELKLFCGFLSLEKSGSKEDVVGRILGFLLEPKDEGKKVPQGKKRKSSSTKRKRKSKKAKTGKKEKRTASKTSDSGGESASESEKENKENEEEEEGESDDGKS